MGRVARADPTLEPLWQDASVVAVRAGYFVCALSWRMPLRVVPQYQLWLTEGGRATLVVGGHTFELSAGTALLVPPHTSSEGTHDPNDPLRCYVLTFDFRVLGAGAPGSLAALPPLLRLGPGRWQEAVQSAEAVYRALEEGGPGHALRASGAMAQLVALLWRDAAEQGALGRPGPSFTGAGGSGVARLAPAIAYIGTHYAERITLQQLADLAHLSPAYFSSTFRRYMGLSPIQYLQRVRLARAKALLADERLSVAAVAAAIGFHDPFYFSRAFRRGEGISPTHYRRAKNSAGIP